MRCRGCNAQMQSHRRTVKEGNEIFVIEEDLCTQCRSRVFSDDFFIDEDVNVEILFPEGRRMPRVSGTDS